METTNRSLQSRSIPLMVLCAMMWSIGGIFIKMVPWNPFVIAGTRSIFAFLVMAVYMIIKRAPVKINRDSLLSGLMLCLTFISFIIANKTTTAANAIVLQYIAPIFVLLLSALLFKQKFLRSDYYVVFATFLGVLLCFVNQMGSGSLLGNIMGLVSGLFLAAMFVCTGNTDPVSRMSGLLLGHFFTAVIGVPLAFVFDTPITQNAVISIVILGVFQVGIPYILYSVAVKHCSPLLCCLIGSIEPILNPIWVYFFNGENPGWLTIVGGLVVIGSITIWSIAMKRTTN